MEELVAIAKIIKPRGIRGEVVATVLTDFPDRFDGLKKVVAVHPNGSQAELIIEDFWFQKDKVVLRFVGVTSMDEAGTLRGLEVCVPESSTPELGEDEFFDWQLSGCEVETTEGERIGTVREVMRTGGTEILVVESDGKEYLIPFAEAICTTVDVANKRIVVDPPEGLLEF